MLLGVVSDSHGHREFTMRAVRMLDSLEVDVVIHCGDIGSVEIAGLFSAWPAHFVFGNVDNNHEELRDAIEAAGQTCHGLAGQLEFEGRKIAFLHSDDALKFRETIESGDFDLVCYGHTHRALLEDQGGVLVLNPGALFRAARKSLAIVELPSLEIQHIPL